jgi:hypothetical protein
MVGFGCDKRIKLFFRDVDGQERPIYCRQACSYQLAYRARHGHGPAEGQATRCIRRRYFPATQAGNTFRSESAGAPQIDLSDLDRCQDRLSALLGEVLEEVLRTEIQLVDQGPSGP